MTEVSFEEEESHSSIFFLKSSIQILPKSEYFLEKLAFKRISLDNVDNFFKLDTKIEPISFSLNGKQVVTPCATETDLSMS